MAYVRPWDGSKEYLRWESDGVWTVEDLNPEHDELAVKLMITIYINEETMCKRLGFGQSKELSDSCKEFWKDLASERVSLACYRHHDDGKELVALNMCTVKYLDEPDEDLPKDFFSEIKILVSSLNYIIHMSDFKKIGISHYLCGCGLFVLPQYRGKSLAGKVLEARESMCKMLGIPASRSIFTSIASQKLATKAGFISVLDISFKQLSDAGFHYSGDPDVILKMMYKSYE